MRTESAKAAAMIRKELKANGINAKVTSKNYSMGSSVNVRINQDITPAAKKEIETFCNKFQYGHFDGMQDLYEYSNSRDDLPQAKYVFLDVNYSDEIKAEAQALAESWGYEGYEAERQAWSLLNGSDHWAYKLWASRKPRVAV